MRFMNMLSTQTMGKENSNESLLKAITLHVSKTLMKYGD